MEDWKTYSFKEIASLSKGKYNPKKENLDLPCIELEHLESETGRLLGYTSSLLQSSTKNRFKPGDILYGKLRPYLRKYYFPNFEGVCSSEIWVLKNEKQKVYNKYLYYVIQTNRFNQNANKSSGTKMPRADWDFVSETVFPIPPFNEQYKIASILSTWDKAIELKEKLIEQKKEQKKGLMQRLLMGHIRMNDRANSTKEVKERLRIIERGGIPKGYKKTKIGIIPKTWKLIRLKDRFDRLTKKNSENNTNVLTISAQHGLVNQQKYFNKSVASANLSNYYILSKGDFAYNKSYSNGYPYGAIKVLKDYEAGVVSPLYICFTPKKDNLSPEFYEYYFEAGLFNREIHAIAQEGARNHGLLNVSINDFFNLHVVDLDIDEMKEISNVISLSIKEVELLEQELNNLKQQKKGLMQLLLSGKVRVQV